MRESAHDCSRTKALLYNHPPKNPRLPIFAFVGRTVAAMVSRTSVGLVSASSSLSVLMSTGMAIKLTKADKEQRQADQLDKQSERRHEQGTTKRKVRKDSSRAA
jgi:hypothetical protein